MSRRRTLGTQKKIVLLVGTALGNNQRFIEGQRDRKSVV